MPSADKVARKNEYFQKLKDLVIGCPKILIITVDNVGSKQLADVRIALRGKATVLMGKNTMIRTALRELMELNPDLGIDKLLTQVKGNIGFVFCEADMNEIRKEVVQYKVQSAAKAGSFAPKDVSLPGGPTGLDPSQTSFFQALNIATKIVKGQIEMACDVHLIKLGAKVQASEQVLLQKLNIKPFEFGIKAISVFDEGSLYGAEILDITDEVLTQMFMVTAGDVAAVSLALGVPSAAAFPHMLINAQKNLAALCSEIDFVFPEVAKMKDFIKNPHAFASAAPAAAAAAPAGGAAKKVVAKEESEEEEAVDFDLFA